VLQADLHREVLFKKGDMLEHGEARENAEQSAD
jgi:hypothetical protein